MQRLAKNTGGYRGETLNLAAVLDGVQRAAVNNGWQREQTPLNLAGSPCPADFLVYHRLSNNERARVYLSTGIHGDEPAGPLAAQRLMEENQWPAHASIWLLPCLNPTGIFLNRRENYQGVDLNRDYRNPTTEEVRVHREWIDRQGRFDLHLCLHEDWESAGFYLYEANPQNRPSIATNIIDAVAPVCPVERAETIDGFPASNGIIRPHLDPAQRPQWPESFYLIMNRSDVGYTLEAPSDFPLAGRVDALVAGTRGALATI